MGGFYGCVHKLLAARLAATAGQHMVEVLAGRVETTLREQLLAEREKVG